MGLLQNKLFAADPVFMNFPGIGGQCPLTKHTIIFCNLLLPLQCPVSLPCRKLRLYLPPGGRCLGAQPQDGGSQRVHSQFGCQRWYLPKTAIFWEAARKSQGRVLITTSKYQPVRKLLVCRPLAPSDAFGAGSLPEGAMGCGAKKGERCESPILQRPL